MKRILLSSALLCGAIGSFAQSGLHVLKIKNAKELRSFFHYTGNDIPFVSGHRGGVNKGFLKTASKPLKIPSATLPPPSRSIPASPKTA